MQNAGQLFQALTYLLLRNRNRGESEAQAARKPALLNTSGTCRTFKLCIIQVTWTNSHRLGYCFFAGSDAAKFTRLSNEARAADRTVRGRRRTRFGGSCPRPRAH